MVYAPMLWEERGVGSILVVRSPPRPFSEREQALLQTFANQAAIAIQNARMFDEVQARTHDLTEALQQQTATAEVLKVISRSAFDLQTVLDTLIASAVELSGANRGAIYLRDGEVFRWLAASGADPDYVEYMRSHPRTVGRSTVVGRVALSGGVECIPDMLEDKEFELPASVLARGRGVLGVPMLRDGRVEGAIVLTRYAPGLYSQRQIDLVQTFADQAVIAIENVRLFDEVQARTRDLTEALQQQTATADVLKAISRTAFDLDTVLETLISTAVRLCEAKYGEIFRRHGDVYRFAASLKNAVPGYVAHEEAAEIRPGRGTLVGRVALEQRAVQIADAWNDPEYAEKDEARMGDVRSMLGVPLMRDGEAIGAFALAPQRACSVHATPGRTRHDLRRPGGDRDRERAAVRRGAGADARPRRGAAAADRDRRRAEGHQPLGVRPADGARDADRNSACALSGARSAVDLSARRRRSTRLRANFGGHARISLHYRAGASARRRQRDRRRAGR